MPTKKELETVTQYLEAQDFLLDKLHEFAIQTEIEQLQLLWSSLKVILRQIDSAKRFFNLYHKFAIEEAIRIAEKSSDPALKKFGNTLKEALNAYQTNS